MLLYEAEDTAAAVVKFLLNQCGVGANSTSRSAISVTGGANLTASTLTVTGSYQVSNGGALNVSGAIVTGAAATADPSSNIAVLAYFLLVLLG